MLIQLLDLLNHITTKFFINKINMQRNQVHAISTHDDLIE